MSRAAVALGALVLVLLVGGTGYWRGHVDGTNATKAAQADRDALVRDTREAAEQGAAAAIARIKITNTTIKGEVRREIETNTVYRDCRLTPDGLRLANEAISGTRTERPGSGELPADPATAK